ASAGDDARHAGEHGIDDGAVLGRQHDGAVADAEADAPDAVVGDDEVARGGGQREIEAHGRVVNIVHGDVRAVVGDIDGGQAREAESVAGVGRVDGEREVRQFR